MRLADASVVDSAPVGALDDGRHPSATEAAATNMQAHTARDMLSRRRRPPLCIARGRVRRAGISRSVRPGVWADRSARADIRRRDRKDLPTGPAVESWESWLPSALGANARTAAVLRIRGDPVLERVPATCCRTLYRDPWGEIAIASSTSWVRKRRGRRRRGEFPSNCPRGSPPWGRFPFRTAIPTRL